MILKQIDIDFRGSSVHHPVFLNAAFHVQVQLFNQVPALCGIGEHLYDQGGGPLVFALFIDILPVADDQDIRLHHVDLFFAFQSG